jgi:cytochrome c oxidase subunit 2
MAMRTVLATGVWPVLAQSGSTFWMPQELSAHASQVDWIFYYIFYVSLFFFLLVVGLMTFFVIRFRRRSADQQAPPSPSHNTPLEVLWTAIPIVLVGTIFVLGFEGYMDLAVMPLNAYEIKVTGQKWKWQFEYATGYVDEDLHVPVDRKIQLTMTSTDVIHSLFIPALRIKRDVVPGRYSKIWFQARTPGEYLLVCAQYCGTGHSEMAAHLIVHPRGEFEQWLQKASNFLATEPPAEAGRRLYRIRGCQQCHSIDGSAGIGPTFQNLFGHETVFVDGSRHVVDENYIRNCILNPTSVRLPGFEQVMPRIQVTDAQIDALIAFIKTLSDTGGAAASQPEATEPAETHGAATQTGTPQPDTARPASAPHEDRGNRNG